MKRFAGSIFGGYKKQEVDEYINFLEEELHKLNQTCKTAMEEKEKEIETLKNEKEAALHTNDSKTAEYDALLAEKNSQTDELNEKLAEKNSRIEELNKKLVVEHEQTETMKQELENLKSQLLEMEQKLESISKNAAQDSDRRKALADMEADARLNADRIMEEARAKAAAYQMEAEAEIKKKVDQVKVARYDFYEYLVRLRTIEKNMMDAYNSLGHSMNQLPFKIDEAIRDAGDIEALHIEYDQPGMED